MIGEGQTASIRQTMMQMSEKPPMTAEAATELHNQIESALLLKSSRKPERLGFYSDLLVISECMLVGLVWVSGSTMIARSSTSFSPQRKRTSPTSGSRTCVRWDRSTVPSRRLARFQDPLLRQCMRVRYRIHRETAISGACNEP